jgi:hypothetical protein
MSGNDKHEGGTMTNTATDGVAHTTTADSRTNHVRNDVGAPSGAGNTKGTK